MIVNANISFNASHHNLTWRMVVQILHSVVIRHLNVNSLYSAVEKRCTSFIVVQALPFQLNSPMQIIKYFPDAGDLKKYFFNITP